MSCRTTLLLDPAENTFAANATKPEANKTFVNPTWTNGKHSVTINNNSDVQSSFEVWEDGKIARSAVTLDPGGSLKVTDLTIGSFIKVTYNYDVRTEVYNVGYGNWNSMAVADVVQENVNGTNYFAPVPKGYVASTVLGETTINGGLVIKEGTNPTADSTTVNEFVWVPLSDAEIDLMRVKISGTNNYRARLWENAIGAELSWSAPSNSTEWREPDALTDTTYGDGKEGVLDEVMKKGYAATVDGFRNQLQDEFNDMVKSIQKYNGFYIGRYETGNINNGNLAKAVVKKGIAEGSIGGSDWWKQYLKCEEVDKTATGVTRTHMLWDTQWDATMRWIAKTDAEYVTNSTGRGNYNNSGHGKVVATGYSEEWKANNIYDMAGNVWEWNMGTFRDVYCCGRGGYYGDPGTRSAGSRWYCDRLNVHHAVGCRTTLLM